MGGEDRYLLKEISGYLRHLESISQQIDCLDDLDRLYYLLFL